MKEDHFSQDISLTLFLFLNMFHVLEQRIMGLLMLSESEEIKSVEGGDTGSYRNNRTT